MPGRRVAIGSTNGMGGLNISAPGVAMQSLARDLSLHVEDGGGVGTGTGFMMNQNGVTSGFEMCFAIGSAIGSQPKHCLEARFCNKGAHPPHLIDAFQARGQGGQGGRCCCRRSCSVRSCRCCAATTASKSQVITSLPFFKMAPACLVGAGGSTCLESRINLNLKKVQTLLLCVVGVSG